MPEWFIPLMSIGVIFNTFQGITIARRQWRAGFRLSPYCVIGCMLFVWGIFAGFCYLAKQYAIH